MTFEELVDLLKRTPNPFQLSRHMEDIISGMDNLARRFDVVEKSRINDMHRMQEIGLRQSEEKQVDDALARDRDDLQRRVADLERMVLELKDNLPAGKDKTWERIKPADTKAPEATPSETKPSLVSTLLPPIPPTPASAT